MRYFRLALIGVVLATLFSCTSIKGPVAVDCHFGQVVFQTNFPGANFSSCKRLSPDRFEIELSPENTPINESPWYSFMVSATDTRQITVDLIYTEHEHRYWPKLSSNGDTWTRLDEKSITVSNDGKQARLVITVSASPLWVSAQELVTSEDHAAWIENQVALSFVSRSVLGSSVNGNDIIKLETKNNAGRYVVLVGRQHPPEITGTLAMQAFVERLFAADKLARSFREAFGTIIVPLMNPDGVDAGYWRHNINGIDLNRDWGPFTQPETQTMQRELERFEENGGSERLWFFADFHSTRRDLIYSNPAELPVFPANLEIDWVMALENSVQETYPDYEVELIPGQNLHRPTSKAYIYNKFKAPAVTFELGDETDRTFIRFYATVAAEELMKQLLERVKQ